MSWSVAQTIRRPRKLQGVPVSLAETSPMWASLEQYVISATLAPPNGLADGAIRPERRTEVATGGEVLVMSFVV